MAEKPYKARVKEIQKGRRKDPRIIPLSWMAFANFTFTRYFVKAISWLDGGYGPSPLSPKSQEYLIDYRDFFGWDDYDREKKDIMPVIPFALGNEMALLGAFKRYLKTRHLKMVAPRGEPDFWEEMEEYAASLGVDIVGYTPADSDYIFQGMRVLYPNLVVLGMEMRWPQMSQAPAVPASVETIRVYSDLGKATNRVADFIMERGYPAQPLPPYSMYFLWPAVARSAGLAERGLHGLMITPRFGPMQRFSVVATTACPLPRREPVDMGWLPDFCASCRRCIEACPAGAVLEEPLPKQGDIVTHIDNEKCYPYFARYRGCSVCIKVCAQKLRAEGLISSL
jgi:ferredoxin